MTADLSLVSVPLTVDHLGAMGDGVALHEGKQLFIPFACPGDVLEVTCEKASKESIVATIRSVVEPSPQRQTPICSHFGACGGCRLQHLEASLYRSFKQTLLQSFIEGMALDHAVLSPMVEMTQRERRRIDYAIAWRSGELRLGFYAFRSHHLIDISECPISMDALTDIIPALRGCLKALKKPGRLRSVSLTALEHGLDAVVHVKRTLSASDRDTLKAFAQAQPIVRLTLSWQEGNNAPVFETLYDEQNATITLSGVDVFLPAGAFLQATEKGAEAITQHVVAHLAGCKRIADLYAGCGTYSFPLLSHVERVTAYEGCGEMMAAAHNAILAHGLEHRMEAITRDLFHAPLSVDALRSFDGIVINPPRNGAFPQIKAIAKSGVGKVAMVSCNPATFKRDARLLLEAHYRLVQLIPIDQFYWSHHLELVALFEKDHEPGNVF